MFTIVRNVGGKFVAIDRGNDVNEFCNEYREIINGFLGIQYNGEDDNLNFNFDEALISHSTAQDLIVQAVEDFYPTSLNILKKEMCDKVNVERDSRLYSYFPYAGYRWDCNVESRANIIGTVCLALLLGGQVPQGMVWRDYDNVNHPADFNFMAQMGLNMFIYSQQVYGASWYHKGKINSLSNATAITNYDFSVNWPNRNPS